MKARAARATLTDAQKKKLFEARRRLELSSFDQQQALCNAAFNRPTPLMPFGCVSRSNAKADANCFGRLVLP